MRILFVAPWIPSRFRPRSLGLLAYLAKTHDVWLVGLAVRSETAEDVARLGLAGATLVPFDERAAVRRALLALPTRRSLQQSYVSEPRARNAVDELIRDWKPDVLHFNVIRSGVFIPTLPVPMPIVMDLDEIRSDYYRQLAARGSNVRERFLGALEATRLRTAERRAIDRSDVILLSSSVDLERTAGKGQLVRSPHQLRSIHLTRSRNELLFVGRMSYAANVSAVTAFVSSVLPGVRRTVPEAHLTIVGERPHRRVGALSGPSVHVTGAVDDVSEYYARAAVAVVPVTVATGVQMKLIQAFVAGVPAVSTRAAADRAGVEPGVHVLVADTSDEWVTAITSLLRDPALARHIVDNAEAWASDSYSDSGIHAALDSAYELASASHNTRTASDSADGGDS